MKLENDTNSPTLWHIYLIRTASNALYCGITTNVERRFEEHQQGGAKAARFLRGKGPLTLAWSQAVGTRSEALKLEYRIKRLSKQAKERIVQLGVLPPE